MKRDLAYELLKNVIKHIGISAGSNKQIKATDESKKGTSTQWNLLY
jgi:hypothetical protein